MINFRPLTAKETECRIGRMTNDYVFLLLYKNARVDMDILDETVGADNWQREHYEVKGNLYCRVGINVTKDPLNPAWVWKSDCGVESNQEAVKGESSDSFKRACTCWSIGRELYTAPIICIEKGNCNIDTKSGKPKCTDRFYVREMVVEGGVIVRLVIYNAARNIRRNVYEYDKRAVHR